MRIWELIGRVVKSSRLSQRPPDPCQIQRKIRMRMSERTGVRSSLDRLVVTSPDFDRITASKAVGRMKTVIQKDDRGSCNWQRTNQRMSFASLGHFEHPLTRTCGLFNLPENLHCCFNSTILWTDHQQHVLVPRRFLKPYRHRPS